MQVQEVQLDENSFSKQEMMLKVDNFNTIMDISRDSVPLGGSRDVLTESPSIVNTGSIEVPAQAPVKQSSPLKPNHLSSYNYNSSIISRSSPAKRLNEKRLVLSPVAAIQHNRHCSSNVHQDVDSPAKAPMQLRNGPTSVTPQRPSDKMRINNDAALSYQPAYISTTPKPTLLTSGGSRKRLTQGKRSKEAYQLQRMQSPVASISKMQSTA